MKYFSNENKNQIILKEKVIFYTLKIFIRTFIYKFNIIILKLKLKLNYEK